MEICDLSGKESLELLLDRIDDRRIDFHRSFIHIPFEVRFQRGKHMPVELVDLLKALPSHKDAVVLKDDQVGDALQGHHRPLDRVGENEAGFHQIDPERLGKELPGVFCSFGRTGQSVDERGMQVHDVGKRQERMEQRFDGRTGGLPFEARGHHHLQHFRFPLGIIV